MANYSFNIYGLDQFTSSYLTFTAPLEVIDYAASSFTTSDTLTATTMTVNDNDNVFDDFDWSGSGTLGTVGTQKLAAPLTINGTTYPAGSYVELKTAYGMQYTNPITGVQETTWVYTVAVDVGVNLIGDQVDGTGTYVGMIADGPLYPGVEYTFVGTALDGVGAASIADKTYADIYSGPVPEIPCFTAGTMIETDRGEVAIEVLAGGDLVMTRDNGLQPIRWIGATRLSAAALAGNEKLRPIRIRRHALGTNIPAADLLVSPQHRVLVRSRIAQKMFGTDEVLVAAKQLCQIDGIDIAEDMAGVEYFHMLFDRHEVVISNGAETESLYTGPEALKSVGKAALVEIFTIFPELAQRDYTPVAARTLASGRMGRKLAVRHAQNRKALVM